MADLPTRSDLFDVFAREVLGRARSRSTGRQITADEVYNPASDINLIGAAASAVGEEVMRQNSRSYAETTLDGSHGPALDRWIYDRYGNAIVRKQASPALVNLTFRRTVGGGAFTYVTGSRVATAGGIQFETRADAAFGAGAIGPVTVLARAVNAGTSGNVAKNTLTRFITVPSDSTLTVVNAEPAAGGDASETDTSLRDRARKYFLTLSKGTVPAIQFGALTVPGIRQATAIEEGAATGVLTGRVFLYVADANGQANTALVAAVRTALLEYRCAGINVIIVGAVPTFTTIQYHLSFETNVDSALAFNQVVQATVARVNQLAPQQPLQRSLLFEVARSVPGVIVPADAVTIPVGDVVPPDGSGQVIRTSPDLVTNA